MATVEIIEICDTISNIVAFMIMLIFTVWILLKFRKQKTDKLFVVALCMYPSAYFLLMVGAVFYLVSGNLLDDDKVYTFVNNYILPFNYLVIWTIELLLVFEMQLARVRLSNDEPSQCQKKLRMWKSFRFIVLLASTTFNLEQVYLNTQVDFK